MGIRYFCDRCEKEFKSGGLKIPVYARDAFGVKISYMGDGYLCEKCTEKFNKIKDHIKYEEDFFTMKDEEIDNMDNYKELNLVIKAKKCPYWNYENQTCSHTCRGCEDLLKGNTINTVHCGVMIDDNRYCMLNCDVYGEIIKSLNKKEKIEKDLKYYLDF